MASYGSGIFYGSGVFYTGSGVDKPLSLNFYRTETDNVYVFHWLFNQLFVSPTTFGLDFQLQIDVNSDFSAATTYETTTEVASIIPNGTSQSGPTATINISAGLTLDVNIDGDGAQTIVLALNTTGAAIAADIQTKIQALTAITPANQPAISATTVAYNGTSSVYTITSGGIGITSTVVISGGTAAPSLNLGLAEGGFERTGNTGVLTALPRRVLIVEDNLGTTYTDVSDTTNSPSVGEYIVNLATGILTFNTADLPNTITTIYVVTTSEDIQEFHRGNIVKGFTVPIFIRLDSQKINFFVRVRIKNSLSFGPWSDSIDSRTLEDVTRETADRLLGGLPDRHVYPVDEASAPLAERKTNISKIYEAEGVDFDAIFLEKEHTLRDPRQERTRDNRLFDVQGSRFDYQKPLTMEFVDYRYVVGNMRTAILIGGSIAAIQLMGRSFTGVDPTVIPFSTSITFITASDAITYENIIIPGVAPLDVVLSSAPRIDPTIPGSVIGAIGAAITASGGDTLDINIDGDGAQTITLDVGIYASGTQVATEIEKQIKLLTAFTGSNQPAIDNFKAIFNSATLQYIFVSGNLAPTSSSSVVCTGASLADTLLVKPGGGAIETTGLAYNTPPVTPPIPAGDFTSNYDSGDGATLSFRDVPVSEAGNSHTVVYRSINTTTTYVPASTVEPLVVPGVSPFTVTLANLPVNIPVLTGPSFTFTTGTPVVGEFAVDFSTGVLTFNSADAAATPTATYIPFIPEPPTIFSRIEAGFAIKIILNNPGLFTLDLSNIEFLIKQIVPAHTKFFLEVN